MRGMPATEIAKLKQRLISLYQYATRLNRQGHKTAGRQQPKDVTDLLRKSNLAIDPRIFGSGNL